MYEFDSRVRYSETDAQGRMTWLALMDYFQDCSVFHSEAVNLGVEVWTDAQKAWILSSWQICLNQDAAAGRTDYDTDMGIWNERLLRLPEFLHDGQGGGTDG